MADPKGFEPMTSTSVVWRSNPTELRVRILRRHDPIIIDIFPQSFDFLQKKFQISEIMTA